MLERLPGRLGPSQIDQLPPAIRDPYIAAWAAALRPIFLIAAAIAALGFVLTWFLQERPLRETVADQGLGDSFAAPKDATSLDELETRLSTLARKQNRHMVYDHLTSARGRRAERTGRLAAATPGRRVARSRRRAADARRAA